MKRVGVALLLAGTICQPVLAVDSVVVFNEIHYHPPTNEVAGEWIELHNQMAIDIDLSAWSITGEVGYTFPERTIIPGGGYLVIASDPGALQASTGTANVRGPFAGRLNNSSGILRLRDRNNRLMDRLEYRDGGKWPSAADGSGATLAKRDQNSISDDPENWTSSVRAGGTPGRRNFPAPPSVLPRSVIALNSLWRFEASGTDLGTAWREPAFDDSSWSGRNNATLLSYWPLDGNANAVRGTSGTLVGTITATTDRNGAANGALAFNGALLQYVNVAGGGGLSGATAGTISMWVKWTGTQDTGFGGAAGAVLGRQQNGAFSDDIINLNNASPASGMIQWRQNAAGTVNTSGSEAVGDNVWRHVVITFTDSASHLYVDGVLKSSGSGGALHNNPATPLTIGAWAGDGGSYFTGSIDDVAIWDRPLSAEQVAQLAAQTKTPMDFATPERAVYYAGDGRMETDDNLRATMLPLGATTYYFRNGFLFAGDLARTELKLDLTVDDGAVIYLNGAEVYRHNMPAGPVNYATVANTPVGDAPLMAGITLPTANLVQGTNTVAVEVHQAGQGDAGMIFGAGLTAYITLPPQLEERTLVAQHDVWKFDDSDTDLGSAWRATNYDDSAWPGGTTLFYAGTGILDGVPPERITTISASASTEYTPDGRVAANVVNGAGLVGDAHVNTPGGTMWLNNGTFAVPNDLNPQITFDLGEVSALRSMKIWNYNEDIPGNPQLLSRGVASGDVLVGPSIGALTNYIPGQAFNKAPGTQTDFSQLVDLGGVNARYVKLDKLTNFAGGDNRFVGLSEVQFFRDVELRRTEIAAGPATHYFRKSFHFAGNPAGVTLLLKYAADDGAVFYLNGVEIHRFNMPAGAVTHSTHATSTVLNAVMSGTVAVSAASLVHGANVLAVEVHQEASNGADMIFGAELTARIPPPAPEEFERGALVFNEIGAASTNAFQIELVNAGTQSLNVGGYVLQRAGSSPDSEHVLSSQVIGAGQFLVLDQAALGFGVVPGDKLFLLLPNTRAVADSIEVHERPRARSSTDEWLTPVAVTAGAANSFALRDEIVINEIMYHGPPTLELPVVLGTNTIITLSNVWRYEQSGTDLGNLWRLPGYNDTGWLVGTGLFYNVASNVNLAGPKNTLLELGPITHYFRTTFVYTGAPAILSMTLRHIMDDGIVLYLNGNEISRFNMGSAEPTYSTRAVQNIGNATVRQGGSIAITNLVLGTNVLAAEVHQSANLTTLDVVFGAELTAVVEAVPRVPYSESNEQWVELFNRGSNAVDLTGWRLDEGIDFRFPSNTVLAQGGYLVVAKEPATLLGQYPGIPVVGPYTNSLSRRGERILLRDANDNPADAVHYFDDGRWPGAADGGGASLELRNPGADNSAGEAWAASNESGRSAWTTYSYRGVASSSPVGPDGQWREFVLGLLDSGEVLLDDIMVIETPATTPTNLLQNSTFDAGTNKWRIIGNHHGQVIDDPDQPGNKVLRLIANGSTEHMNNHAETTFVGTRDVVFGREYQISFRAKWISGSRLLNTRLYFNRLPRTTRLNVPALHGTPGTQNSTFTTNIGPTYAGFRHDPPVPAPFAPVTVSVEASDPDGIASLALHWRSDGGAWNSVPMAADVSTNHRFNASIPGKISGSMVQFYVEGMDTFGARSTFPARGTNSRALVKFEDFSAATNGLHNVRLNTLAADADDLFRTVNLMSNERIGCTMIYDEREIFYDVGLRLKGSEHSRTTTPRLGFNVSFDSEQRFRGVHSTVALDRSESTGFGQREMLIHQMLNHAGGVPTKYHDLVQIMAPRPEYTGSAELQLARYSDVFLDDQFPNGSDGTVYEYELVYQMPPPSDNGTAEGNKVPNPDAVSGTAIRNLGDDKEFYRWTMLIKNNEEKDDFSQIMAFAKAMELAAPGFIAQITNIIDVDQWLRGVAVNVLAGCGDSYGGNGAQHNVQFYVHPESARVLYFPHDMDAFFSTTYPIVPNGDIQKLIAEPAFARAYYCHLLEIIETTYNQNYMAHWADNFGRLLPAQNFAGHLAFIGQRATFVAGQVNAAVPSVAFSINNNGGNNFGTTNHVITLVGTAPLNVKEIVVNGVSYPITWTSTTSWSLQLPLFNGVNQLLVQGQDRNGLALTNAVDAIAITNTGPGALLPVVINEWMADNAGPAGLQDPADDAFQDWFELFNPNTNAVNLAGFFLTDNLSQPNKWQIPSPAIISARGFVLVWADNQPGQNGNTNAHLHAAFQLNNGGEAIGLFSPGGVLQHAVVFGDQIQNVSQGLFPDGDTNTSYFMTNWTPRSPNTLAGPLRITEAVVGGGGVELRWEAMAGRTYRVEYKDALTDPSWMPLGGDVVSTNAIMSAIDLTPPNPHRFYRIFRVD